MDRVKTNGGFLYAFPEVKKLWGQENWLVNNEKYCAKILTIKPGWQCSLHFHSIKDETFIVLSGVVRVEFIDDEHKTFYKVLKSGEQFRILPGTPHRFNSVGLKAQVLEISTTHRELDVTRIEESKRLNELRKSDSRFNLSPENSTAQNS